MEMKTSDLGFSRRYLNLLLIQRERSVVGGNNQEKKAGFKSVGEILGSKEYINYTKKKWKL